MTGRCTVLLDACVLYPAPLRDLLMQLALGDFFHARWSDQIHAEWMKALLEKRPDLKQADLDRVRNLMNLHARDSLVTGHEPLIESIRHCPDPHDRHVIAAAWHGNADAIITFNLRDFPAAALEPYGLEAIHPDEFLRSQLDMDLAGVLAAVRVCRARLRNPPKQASDYLDTLEAQQLPKTVAELRRYSSIL